MNLIAQEASLYSAYWYRVAGASPRLQPGTRVRQQILRGEEWFVFTHPISGQHFRVNRKAYEVIGRLNGELTLDALWLGLQRTLGDDAPTQDEVIALLAQLFEIGLVLFDKLPDISILRRHGQTQRQRKLAANLNPFAFRVRLFNPDLLLRKLSFVSSVVARPMTRWLWCILVAWALMHTILSWDEIQAYAKVHLLTPRCLFLAWAIYPMMKILHELGHAFAVRHWGGKVEEAGVGFFMLVPTPYVDASSATTFSSKWQRAAVSFAGIGIELALAALALIVWSVVDDGMIRDMALIVMAIGGLSTILFNGNPLLRFDGYYILCDLLEMPNLALRSREWWRQVVRQFIGGVRSAQGKPISGGERFWLFVYAPASWIYRVFISVVIVQWVVMKSVVAGLAALAWLVFLLLVRPAREWLADIFPSLQSRTQNRKRSFGLAVATAVSIATLFFVPVPGNTVADGVVWLPEQSQVRTQSDGQVITLHADAGQQVNKGQALITLAAPQLLADKRRIQAQIARAEAEQFNGWQKSLQQGRDASDELSRLRADLAQLEEQIANLTLRAEVDGKFVFAQREELIGRHMTKGTVVAYVLPPDSATVRVAVSQNEIGRIVERVGSISVRLADSDSGYFEGKLLRMEPAATKALPSKAIGDRGGGNMVTDPNDPEGMTTLDPFFLVDVQVPGHHLTRAGVRAVVSFSYDAKPLAHTAFWRLQQVFLRTFSMATR